jgi:hypothetical protein
MWSRKRLESVPLELRLLEMWKKSSRSPDTM